MRPSKSLLSLACLALACGPAQDLLPGEATQARIDEIRNGVINNGDPQVHVIVMEWPDASLALCTATLIGRRTLLTAAHCADRVGGAYPSTIYASNLTERPDIDDLASWTVATRSAVHPAWDESALAYATDAAAIELPAFPMIKPKPIMRESLTGMLGATIRATGYGITEHDANDADTKRMVEMQIVSMTRTHYTVATPDEAGICSGDSGGPTFFVFPDGVERQIGIHSYGKTMLNCRGGTDVRTDAQLEFIDGFLAESEAAECGQDGLCAEGCMPEDPDCACVADGTCAAGCAGVSVDPDCPDACAQNGLCGTDCASGDPDCAEPFGGCASDEDCPGRLCASDPQSFGGYCSTSCAMSSECPEGYECDQAVCKRTQLPEAAPGEPCTFGETFCEGTGYACTGVQGEETTCTWVCRDDIACDEGQTCEEGQNGVRFCQGGEEPPPEETGCGCRASAPQAVLPGALFLLLLVVSRRRTPGRVREPAR